jgi:hypothetical protein
MASSWDETPWQALLSPCTPPRVVLHATEFQRWRARRGGFNEDVDPAMVCRGCGGVHEFRVACAIETMMRGRD